MSSYQVLIDLTSEIIIERSKCYRNLVVAFVGISLLSIGLAIFTISLWPVSGVFLLIPAYGAFLICDSYKLNHWRAQVMGSWKSKTINISALRESLTANKILPEQTIQGMLETLLDAGSLVGEQSVPICIREPLADALMARDDNLSIQLKCRTIIHATIVVGVISAIIINTWSPLLMLIAVPMVVFMCNWCRRRRILKAVDKVTKYRESDGFDHTKYREIAKTINWQGISSRDKQRLIM